MIKNLTSYAISLAFISLSLPVFRIIGKFPVSLGALLVPIFLASNLFNFKIKSRSLIFFLIVQSIIFFNAIYFRVTDHWHFLRTYILISTFLLSFFISQTDSFRYIKIIDFKKIIYLTGFSLLFLEFFQIFEAILFKNYSFWTFLDEFSISTSFSVLRFESVVFTSYIRPISFYHEPSFLAALLFLFIVTADFLELNKSYIVLLIVGLFFTLSASILIIFTLFCLFKYFKINSSFSVLSLLFVLMLMVFFFDDFMSVSRLNELFLPGTSGYNRIILPITYVSSVLDKSLSGIPLGSYEVIPDNSLSLFFIYFGIAGVPLLFFLFIDFFILLGSKVFISYLFIFISFLFMNGAFFSLENCFIFIFLNLIFFRKYHA